MSSREADAAYRELKEMLSKEYRNPAAVLNSRIDELVEEGKSREEAILSLYEEEKRREIERERNQHPLDERVRELEEEIDRLRQDRMSEAERARDFSPPREDLTKSQVVFIAFLSLFFPIITAIVFWVMWRQEQPDRADQAVAIAIVVSVLGFLLYWFLLL